MGVLGLVTDVLLFPITGPVWGLVFVLEEIRDQANAQMLDSAGIRDELSRLRMRFEQGELSAEEFAAYEDALLERLNAILRDSISG